MEYSAIIHDMDKRFCYAIDKDLFVIRIQVKRDDIKEIILHYEDKYIPMEWKDTRKTIPMKKVATSQFQDYYEAQIQMHLICLRYFFELARLFRRRSHRQPRTGRRSRRQDTVGRYPRGYRLRR